MKRYFLSQIIGTGTIDDPYRAALSDYNGRHSALIPTDASGVPTHAWALMVVDAPDLVARLGDARGQGLPDLTLDARLSSLSVAQRNALQSALLNRFGVDVTLTGTMSFRQLIRNLGLRLTPIFNENAFDVTV